MLTAGRASVSLATVGPCAHKSPDPLDTGRLQAGPQDALPATNYLPRLFSFLGAAVRSLCPLCAHRWLQATCRLRAVSSTPSIPKARPGGRQAQQAVSLLSLLIIGTLRIPMS